MINNAKLAVLFAESLAKQVEKGRFHGYVEGSTKSEVRPWSEWVGGHP